MRKKLAAKSGIRETYKGTFVRIGAKRGYRGDEPTVLIENILTVDGEHVTNHLWFNLTKGFKEADLQLGDIVMFNARSKEYEKGYKGRRWDVFDKPIRKDYKLVYPTNIKVLKRSSTESNISKVS